MKTDLRQTKQPQPSKPKKSSLSQQIKNHRATRVARTFFEKYPGFAKTSYAIGVCLWTTLVFLLVRWLVAYPFTWLLTYTRLSENFVQCIYSFFTYAISLAIIVLVPKKLEKTKLASVKKNLGLFDLPTFTDLGLAPVGFVAYIVLGWLVATFFQNFSWYNAYEQQEVGFKFAYNFADRLLIFIPVILIAPIAEEIIFRGFLYSKIKQQFGKKSSSKWHNFLRIAVPTLVTSLLFGFMHLSFTGSGFGQLNTGISMVVMGIVLCLLREISGDSIYAGIIMHMLKNLIALYALYQLYGYGF